LKNVTQLEGDNELVATLPAKAGLARRLINFCPAKFRSIQAIAQKTHIFQLSLQGEVPRSGEGVLETQYRPRTLSSLRDTSPARGIASPSTITNHKPLATNNKLNFLQTKPFL